MTIELHQFSRPKTAINFSPFCVKLETWMRLAKIPHTVVENPRMQGAPKGKMPFIKLDNGEKIGDSNLVIEYFEQQYNDPIDRDLSAEQRAVALAFRRMIDENLYWPMMYSRWLDNANWPLTRKVLFAKMPAPLVWFVPEMVREKLRKQMFGHGMGRHSQAEIYAMGCKDISAISAFLGERNFAFGDRATSLDCAIFSPMSNLFTSSIATPLVLEARKYANLRAHTARIWQAAFPDITMPSFPA